MNRARRVAGVAALATTCAVTLSSYGFTGLYSAPLPGGADLGSHPFTITVSASELPVQGSPL